MTCPCTDNSHQLEFNDVELLLIGTALMDLANAPGAPPHMLHALSARVKSHLTTETVQRAVVKLKGLTGG